MNSFVTPKEKTAYLTAMFGQNMLYAAMITGVNFYFQSVIFLPAISISVITIVSKIIEFISDPVMGYFIDATDTKYGKCRPYLIFAPIPVCICSILVFMNCQYSTYNSLSKNIFIIIWAGISIIMFGIVYSIGDVALWSFPSLITPNKNTRNQLLADAKTVSTISSSLFVLIVLQLSQYTGNMISEKTGNNANGLQIGTIIVCCSIIVAGSALFQSAGLFVKERAKYSKKKISLKESFIIMWRCEPFRFIMLSGILRSPYMLLNTVQNTLFIYYFGNNGQNSYIIYMLILGGFTLAANLIANSITPNLAKKHKKSSLSIIFNIIGAIAFALIFIVYLLFPDRLSDVIPFAVLTLFTFISSLALGIVFALQSFMIGDAVDYEEKNSNYRPDGIFFSGQTLLIKISTGISSVISGIIYTISGFSGDNISKINTALFNGADFKSEPQFAKYRFAIFLMISIIPAIGLLLSVIPIKKYSEYETKESPN